MGRIIIFSPQGVHLGGWEPGDPQRDTSGWGQVYLLCREWPGQRQQHRVSIGYRQVPANEQHVINNYLYASYFFFLPMLPGQLVLLWVMSAWLAIIPVTLCATKPSWPPNVYGCWIMALWAEWQYRYSVFTSRVKARWDFFRSDVIRVESSPLFNGKWALELCPCENNEKIITLVRMVFFVSFLLFF